MASFAFVIIPITSILTCICTDLPVYGVTLSQIAWFHNKLWVVYIWGAISVIPLIFTVYNVCKAGNYSKTGTLIFTIFNIIALIIIVTGLSISSAKSEQQRLVHVGFCTTGFLLFLVMLLGLTFSMCRRNPKAFMLSLFLDAFLLITGIFMVFEARSFSNNVSAIAEAYCFMLYNVVAVLDYYLLKLIPSKKKQKK